MYWHSGYIYSDDIMEFDPITEQWSIVDNMIDGRYHHGVTVVNFDSGLCV